ncbi:unnamed protein product [Euphydryas editha]|uniref:BSD domain-containing protein n=1 Tax=Euphydryas editha TaxID=104508 RepID=A0AAU9U8D4_EUPED|nr:unnamed protein product [Euphydryas editha]
MYKIYKIGKLKRIKLALENSSTGYTNLFGKQVFIFNHFTGIMILVPLISISLTRGTCPWFSKIRGWQTVSILGEFNREQDAFIKGQEGRSGAAVPPWVGAPNEAALKEECLSLSTDRRNFVRAPPAGVEFDFDYNKMYPVAVAIMDEDPNLSTMRFDLVPKVITEENFWRNYFYRVSLICQANEADAAGGRQSSAEDSQDDKSASDDLIAKEKASQESIADAKERIKSLKVDGENDDEQWEKELEAELKEYEVVAEKTNDDKWEKECEDLLGDDVDLK